MEQRQGSVRRIWPVESALAPARRWASVALAVAGLPLLTLALVQLRASLSLGSVLLLYLLAVVLISVVGGTVVAVLTAVLADLLVNYFFVLPYGTLFVNQRDDVVALVAFVAVAVVVSVLVEVAIRRGVAVERSRAETELLSRVASEPVGQLRLDDVLAVVRQALEMDEVRLVDTAGGGRAVLGSVGSAPTRGTGPTLTVPAGGTLRLEAWGQPRFAPDVGTLRSMAEAAARAIEAERLADEAARGRALAEVDRLRSALLAAVGHDLRTPLASVKAAVTSLRQEDVEWTAQERAELLETIDDSADRLDALLANLLAMSRMQAGALSVALCPVALDEVVSRALLSLGRAATGVDIQVADDLPLALADPGLLERAVANVLANAVRFAGEQPVRVLGVAQDDHLQVRVEDHGPGIAAADRERAFVPFQRLDDHGGGVGLGLAIAKGFLEAMNGSIKPSATPGGGLTMTLTLPRAA